MNAETNKYSLTDGVIWKSLAGFAIPVALSNLFQQLYNTVDCAVLGVFAGDRALAAVGSTGNLVNLLVGFFLGIAVGAGVLYGISFGARDEENMRRVGGGAILLSLLAGVCLTVLGVVGARWMLRATGTPDEVLDLAVLYLQIFFAGILPALVYNVGAALIRSAGDSRRPFIYLVVSGVLNLVLDIFCVAVLGIGVAGAAIATVFSQLVAALLVCRYIARGENGVHVRLSDLRIDRATASQLARMALPCGAQSSMFNIANLLMQTKTNTFGYIAVAGVASYAKIDGFLYMPVAAMSLSISTFVSQNIGAGKLDRVRRGVKTGLVMALSVAAVSDLIVIFTAEFFLGFFSTNPDVIKVGVRMMWFMAPYAWLFCLSDMLGGAMRGAGAAFQVTAILALCICAFRVVFLTVTLNFWYDIRVVFLCFPISWVLSSTCMALYYRKGSWMKAYAGRR